MMKFILFIFLLLSFSFSWNLFEQVQLTKKNGAMCMDGSQANIYTYQSDEQKPPNKLLIFFQQIWQGWCVHKDLSSSLTNCYKYISDKNFMDFGSSNNYPSDTFFLTGILSSESIFASWNKVLIKSCDGGSYFSDSSVVYKNKTMNFRGYKNIIEAMEYLKKINWIQNRDQVLLVGQMNGGLAALAWANKIKQYTKGKVRVLADASVMENFVNQKTKGNDFQNRMKTMEKVFLNEKTSFVNQKCTTANSDNINKCFYSSELVKYIDPSIDILFLQSYYDSWALEQILGLDCAAQFGSLSQCTTQHRQYIQDFHKIISTSMHSMVKQTNVAVFGIACVAHYLTTGKFDYQMFQVPMNSGNTAQNVTAAWIANKGNKIHLDQVQWPHNTACSKKAYTKNQLLLRSQ